MPGANRMRDVGNWLTESHLNQAFGAEGPRKDFMSFYSLKYETKFDDFNNKALNTTNDWTVAAGGGATTWARTAGAPSFIRGVHGSTAATSGLQLLGPLADWFGDLNCGIQVRYRTDNITEKGIELGFGSTFPSVSTLMVNSLVTPTFNTTANGALYVYNHTGSTTTSGLYTIGTAIAAAKKATTTNRPVVSTFQTIRLEIITNRVRVWVDGNLMANQTEGTTDYIEGGTALRPVVSLLSSDTNSANFDIDYILVWQDRSD